MKTAFGSAALEKCERPLWVEMCLTGRAARGHLRTLAAYHTQPFSRRLHLWQWTFERQSTDVRLRGCMTACSERVANSAAGIGKARLGHGQSELFRPLCGTPCLN